MLKELTKDKTGGLIQNLKVDILHVATEKVGYFCQQQAYYTDIIFDRQRWTQFLRK